MEDREVGGSLLLNDLERGALERKDGGLGETENGIGGKHKKWSDALPPALTENMGKYRSYNGREVRDLLRVIRNKSNHFRELPRNVRETVGDPPDAFYRYFETRFPKLALHAFEFVKKNVAHEPQFAKYFFGSAGEGEEGGGEGVTRRGSGGGGDAETTGASAALAKAARQIANGSARRASARASLVASSPAVEYPERPGAPECGFYVKTGRCKFGGRCHFHHPKGVHQ
jgi:serine/threonine-protein kinase/endoribonuclease IRE1